MEYKFETKQAGHPGLWAEFGGNIQFPVHVKIKCKKGQNISGIISLAHTFLLKKRHVKLVVPEYAICYNEYN